MAWDTERTKRLLLDAATEEFSAHGLAGARVDRIAAAAGVNKERIYQYFGKKDELFAAVLHARLVASMDEVPMLGEGPDAVAEYAVRLFDHHLADGVIPRLVFWEGLERGSAAVTARRLAYHARKLDAFQAMLPGAEREPAGELLLTIVTLVNAWPVLGHLDELMLGADPDRIDRRREAIRAAARALAAAAAQPTAAAQPATEAAGTAGSSPRPPSGR
jgi:AcrR family transcriptional regulator